MSSISAGTTSGSALVSTGNTDGTLQLQVNGTTPSVTLAANGAVGVGSTPSYGTNGQVLTSAGSAAAPTWSTVSSTPGVNVQTFTSSSTWTKPSGYSANSRVLIQTWGGGGAGSQNLNLGCCGTVDGSGGGGGAYNYRWITLSAMGSTESITIGAGGITNAAAGGNTTVGSLVISYGGAGGVGGGGNGGGQLPGSEPFSLQEGTNYSAYGGNRHSREKGGAGNGTTFSIGFYAGGNSVWGGGGGGGGRQNGTISNVGTGGTSSYGGNGGRGAYPSNSAEAGSVPGGGGGGGIANASALFGVGGNGQVIITVFAGA